MNKLFIAAIATIGFSTAALAQGTDFASVDTDGSGDVSFEEAQAAWPELSPDEFATYDLDGNGVLTPDEFEALAFAAAPPAEEPALLDEPAPIE